MTDDRTKDAPPIIGLKEMVQVLTRKEFYVDMIVFVFVCITGVLILLRACMVLDRRLGFGKFIHPPWSSLFFAALTAAGALVIWYAYTYLVLWGEGSPCPQMGGTRRLVRSGPYAVVRHPSVIGKLLGITGLGCLFGSVTFTFILIPVLFAWSIFYNRFIQERECVKRFGEEYLRYRRDVPMIIPGTGGGRKER